MAPSWQARLASTYFKLVVRTHRWGDENALPKRARRLFGAPKLWQWFTSRGLRVEQVRNEKVRGEWITPKKAYQTIVLYIHGGGFVAGSSAGHRPITASLARLGNFKIFSLDYRLAPENRFPAALDDVLAAYRWLIEQNISPNKIALAGDSAGGGLVLSTLLRMRDENLPFPACAVCFSPWTDLAGTGDSLKLNGEKDAMFRPENIHQFAAAYLGKALPSDQYASPVLGEFDAGFPPVLFQVGSTEVLLDDSRRIYDKIQKANGISGLEIYEDAPHCWQMFDSMMPEARIALQKAVEFIDQHSSKNDSTQTK
ncbi:MAG: alpha/beta hydrolase [Pyrinomonadaceae bacterium]